MSCLFHALACIISYIGIVLPSALALCATNAVHSNSCPSARQRTLVKMKAGSMLKSHISHTVLSQVSCARPEGGTGWGSYSQNQNKLKYLLNGQPFSLLQRYICRRAIEGLVRFGLTSYSACADTEENVLLPFVSCHEQKSGFARSVTRHAVHPSMYVMYSEDSAHQYQLRAYLYLAKDMQRSDSSGLAGAWIWGLCTSCMTSIYV